MAVLGRVYYSEDRYSIGITFLQDDSASCSPHGLGVAQGRTGHKATEVPDAKVPSHKSTRRKAHYWVSRVKLWISQLTSSAIGFTGVEIRT